jgi:hypothetical protein
VITRINAKVEKALRTAMGHVAHAEPDQIEPDLGVLDDDERLEAIALSMAVACYVVIDVCRNRWPSDASLRQVAEGLATTGTTARELQLDAGEIYTYLAGTVFGGRHLEDVILGEATRLPVIVAERATVVYSPKEMDWWVYLDQIEAALEAASALDATVVPAVVMRAYLPAPEAEK